MTDFDHFLGTRPVSGQHAFDLVALSNWLSNNLPGFIGPLTVEMFKGGQSNPTYKLCNSERFERVTASQILLLLWVQPPFNFPVKLPFDNYIGCVALDLARSWL